jgi:hypothetical protein
MVIILSNEDKKIAARRNLLRNNDAKPLTFSTKRTKPLGNNGFIVPEFFQS